MEQKPLEVALSPVAQWPDEHVERAYRLLSGDVKAQLASGDPDPAELAAARRDAELFGIEAMRRGLLG
jgi:hypothetical protein